jgi:pyruvate dehydrogenase E1 component alpha subunit
VFLEIKTYRYRGHSMSDPAKYRTPEELESYKKQDPILILKSRMEESGRLTAEAYAALDSECKSTCDDAVKFAEESQEPEPSALYEDILA